VHDPFDQVCPQQGLTAIECEYRIGIFPKKPVEVLKVEIQVHWKIAIHLHVTGIVPGRVFKYPSPAVGTGKVTAIGENEVVVHALPQKSRG
jgi:hypothetical protein